MTAFSLSSLGAASLNASSSETAPEQGSLNNLTIRLRSSQATKNQVNIQEIIQEKGKGKEKEKETDSKNKPPTEETDHVPNVPPNSPGLSFLTPSISLSEGQYQLPVIGNTIQFIGSPLVSTHAATKPWKEDRYHPYNSARFQELKAAAPAVGNTVPIANDETLANQEALIDNKLASHEVANQEPLTSWDKHSHSDSPTEKALLPPLGQRAPSLKTVTNDNPLANEVVASWDPCSHSFNPWNPDMIPELDRPIWTLTDQERTIARIEKWRGVVKAAEGSEMEKENIMCKGVWVNVDLEESESEEEWVEIVQKKRREVRFFKGEEGWDRTVETFGRMGLGNVE